MITDPNHTDMFGTALLPGDTVAVVSPIGAMRQATIVDLNPTHVSIKMIGGSMKIQTNSTDFIISLKGIQMPDCPIIDTSSISQPEVGSLIRSILAVVTSNNNISAEEEQEYLLLLTEIIQDLPSMHKRWENERLIRLMKGAS